MENEEILQYLSKLDKKLDKITKIVTTVAKTLHVLPVSEKEEREIQIAQRKNAKIMQTIQEELASLEAGPKENNNFLSFSDLIDFENENVYEDIIGDDYIH